MIQLRQLKHDYTRYVGTGADGRLTRGLTEDTHIRLHPDQIDAIGNALGINDTRGSWIREAIDQRLRREDQ